MDVSSSRQEYAVPLPGNNTRLKNKIPFIFALHFICMILGTNLMLLAYKQHDIETELYVGGILSYLAAFGLFCYLRFHMGPFLYQLSGLCFAVIGHLALEFSVFRVAFERGSNWILWSMLVMYVIMSLLAARAWPANNTRLNNRIKFLFMLYLFCMILGTIFMVLAYMRPDIEAEFYGGGIVFYFAAFPIFCYLYFQKEKFQCLFLGVNCYVLGVITMLWSVLYLVFERMSGWISCSIVVMGTISLLFAVRTMWLFFYKSECRPNPRVVTVRYS